MDEFQQKLVLALVDKIPLLIVAIVAAVASLKASKVLEAYKSDQALYLELGKAKAAVVLRVLQALSECRFKCLRVLTEVRAENCDDEKVMKLVTEFHEDWTKLQDQLGRERMLVGSAFSTIAHSLGSAASDLTTAVVTIRRHAISPAETPEALRGVASARETIVSAAKEIETATIVLESILPSLKSREPAILMERRLAEIPIQLERRLAEIRELKVTKAESPKGVLSEPSDPTTAITTKT